MPSRPRHHYLSPMTAQHQKLKANLEIIDNLLNKRYQNGQGLDSGTKEHLLKRKGEIKQQLKSLKKA